MRFDCRHRAIFLGFALKGLAARQSNFVESVYVLGNRTRCRPTRVLCAVFAADLQAELARKDIEIAANAAEIHAKTLHIEKLKMQLAVLRRARFGRSSEKLDREIEQLELLIGELEEDAAAQEARANDGRPDAKADPQPPRQATPAQASRSASRCRRICRARPSPTNRPAPARAAAAQRSAGSARTSARCSNTSPPASR